MKDFVDNRKMHSTRQKGIERVKNIKPSDYPPCHYQGGKMHNKPETEANWSRKGDSLTPRRG